VGQGQGQREGPEAVRWQHAREDDERDNADRSHKPLVGQRDASFGVHLEGAKVAEGSSDHNGLRGLSVDS
jgi:hypothetical protein